MPQAYRGERTVVVGRVRTHEGAPDVEPGLDVLGPVCARTRPALVSIEVALPPGSSGEELDATGRKIARDVAKLEERAVTIVGQGPELSIATRGSTGIEVLAPAGDDPDVTVGRLLATVMAVPGVALVDVTGARTVATLDVQHDEHEVRALVVAAMGARARTHEGVFVAGPIIDGAPQLAVTLTDRGRALGLTTSDLGRQIRSATDHRRVTPLMVFGPGAAAALPEIIEAGESASPGISIRGR